MACRYLFLCPDSTSASGGIAVIYDVVALLNKSGYCAIVVHNSPDAGYPDYSETVPMLYTKEMNKIYWRYLDKKNKLKAIRIAVG
jgi:hypothetical protein